MIILGVLNLSDMFYYIDTGIKYSTNSILSVAFHIIQKKILFVTDRKITYCYQQIILALL